MGRPGGLAFLEAPGAGAFRLAGSKRRQDRCYTRSALDASGRDRPAGAEAQAVAAGAAARREGADPGRGLCLRRPATPLRRGRNRRAGVRSRPFRGEPHCAPPPGLQRLRADRPVGPALAPNRARPAGPGPAVSCPGFEVRGSLSALPPVRHLWPRGHRPGPLDLGGLGGSLDGAAGAAGRSHRPPRAGRPGDLRRRHADQAAGQEKMRNGADLDLCSRRASLVCRRDRSRDRNGGRRRSAGGLVSLLREPQGRTSRGTLGRLQGLDARRGLCRLQRPVPRRRHPRSGVYGAHPAQVLRCLPVPGPDGRRGGPPSHRRALCRREGGTRPAAGRTGRAASDKS